MVTSRPAVAAGPSVARPGSLGAPASAPAPAGRVEASPRDSSWSQSRFVIRERRLTLGRQYRIEGGDGRPVAYVAQRWMRIKEAWTVYTDQSKAQVAFQVKATKVFDFQANLEVRDANGTLLGTLRRKGWASMVADRWQVLGPDGVVRGELQEDKGRGLARRMLTRLIPYRARIASPQGRGIARVEGTFQLWGDTYSLHLDQPELDARVLCCLVVVVDSMAAERGSILDATGLGS